VVVRGAQPAALFYFGHPDTCPVISISHPNTWPRSLTPHNCRFSSGAGSRNPKPTPTPAGDPSACWRRCFFFFHRNKQGESQRTSSAPPLLRSSPTSEPWGPGGQLVSLSRVSFRRMSSTNVYRRSFEEKDRGRPAWILDTESAATHLKDFFLRGGALPFFERGDTSDRVASFLSESANISSPGQTRAKLHDRAGLL